MARQKNYDREDTVRKARDAFWEHGYQNLGVRAIEDIVGVGRFAIRTDFNGKEGLFIEALTSYREELLRNVIRPIQEADDLSVFDRIMTQTTNPDNHSCSKYGCLFVNTMVENASLQNKEFQEFTDNHFNKLSLVTTELIDRLKSQGLVKKDIDSKAAGEFVKGAFIASSLMSRDAHDASASAGYAKMALSTIHSWNVNN
jgi:AcrR family transcriptional regulator